MIDIKKYFKNSNLSCNDCQAHMLHTVLDLLISNNENINLTSIINPDEVITKHFADSCVPLLIDNLIPDQASLIDIGTGAGFPGLPLQILRPDISVTMLDSTKKKINHIDSVLESIKKIPEYKVNASVLHSRAEDSAKNPDYRGNFDVCVSRAVAGLSILIELCIPFLKTGGIFIAYKNASALHEITASANAFERTGAQLQQILYYTVNNNGINIAGPDPADESKRILAIIKKAGNTPTKYPRKFNEIKNKPL